MNIVLTRFRIAVLILLFAGSVFTGAGIGWYEKEAGAILLIGGRSTIIQFCNDGAFVIAVGPPRPGTFKITWHTRIYLYGQFMSSWVLGNAWPGGICCTGKICTPVMGTAIMIGTSPA